MFIIYKIWGSLKKEKCIYLTMSAAAYNKSDPHKKKLRDFSTDTESISKAGAVLCLQLTEINTF